MKTIAFIFARGGSKGLLRKNIRVLGDRPLIAHSITIAKNCPSISRVVVSTDDKEIADVALEYGAEVPFMRPAELAQDNTPEWLAWQHAIAEIRKKDSFEKFVSLPATSPFRSVKNVEDAILLLDRPHVDFVISATKAERNPWFNMIKKNTAGFAEIVNSSPEAIFRRQDAPAVWDVTTVVYASRPDYIMKHSKIFEGNVDFVEIEKERALDIDTAYDFQMAEFIYANLNKQVSKI